MKATFFLVTDNAAKVKLICNQAHACFQKQHRLLILVPNIDSARYVDDLLWTNPKESFLPHVVSDFPTSEWIVISQASSNINNASHIFNLCPNPLSFEEQALEVFEFFDESSPQKLEFSLQRKQFYQTRGDQVKIQQLSVRSIEI